MKNWYKENGLKQTSHGACFPDRPYFPLMLANGCDAMLISLDGAMDSMSSMAYSPQLPFDSSLGWYKTARKDWTYSEMTYGDSVALADSRSSCVLGKEKVAIINSRQYFEPKTGILTTFNHYRDARSSQETSVKVTTFLTRDHLLVERHEAVKTNENPMTFEFVFGPAAQPSRHELRIRAEQVEFDGLADAPGFQFSYRISTFNGVAAIWTDDPDAIWTPPDNPVYDIRNHSPHVLVTQGAGRGRRDGRDPLLSRDRRD